MAPGRPSTARPTCALQANLGAVGRAYRAQVRLEIMTGSQGPPEGFSPSPGPPEGTLSTRWCGLAGPHPPEPP